MLACSLHACVPITCILTLRACRVSVCMCKCQCRSVSVCSANVVEVSVCKCKCRSVSVQGIFRKNPSQCFWEQRQTKRQGKKRKVQGVRGGGAGRALTKRAWIIPKKPEGRNKTNEKARKDCPRRVHTAYHSGKKLRDTLEKVAPWSLSSGYSR